MKKKNRLRSRVRPIRVDGDIAFITLTRGLTAIIDTEDVPLVEDWNWFASPSRNRACWYAARSSHRTIRLHEEIFPAPDGMTVDHADRDGLNNRRSNLRHATRSQNSQNKRRQLPTLSKYKGITHNSKNSWVAKITVGGRRLNLGSFPTPEDAARAYDAAARAYFGAFAAVNFP